MKSLRALLAILVFTGIAGLAFPAIVPVEQAKQVAVAAWIEKTHQPAAVDASLFSGSSVAMNPEGKPVYYAFNVSGNKGFILISGDDRVMPVLGWSLRGSYEDTNRPPAFTWFMKGITGQIDQVIGSEDTPEPAVTVEWNRYLSAAFVPMDAPETDPLIQTRWDQGCFYNEMCPPDAAAVTTCFHALTGCGATAMAQILKFWGSPVHGTGSYGYNHPTYGYLFADFGAATYQYDQMPDTLSGSNAEVAKLIYHCGVAQEMDYGVEASTSLISVIDNAFRDYFNFSSTLNWKSRGSYSSAEWETMLRGELDAGRPLFYYGNDNVATGHAFICDGYQGTSYFHFNWGWSGSYDGYFLLDDLTPGGSSFTANQQAVFDLFPEVTPVSYTMDFESVNDFSLTFSPWKVIDQDGSPTYTITDHTFPNNGEPMAFIAFNPEGVTPSMSGDAEIQPHGGSRFGACFSATSPPNNDWFISPAIQMKNNGWFSCWVKSYTDSYGLEKYKVAVSTTDTTPASFTVISGANALEAPIDWTQKTFDLSEYEGRKIYVAIQCVSSDAFIFMIDDLEVNSGGTENLIADFTGQPTTINQGETVDFTDATIGSPIIWQWNFQGGTPATSNEQNPTGIRYNTPGTYNVTLTVNDGTETDTKLKNGYITVKETLPSHMTLDFEGLSDFTTSFDPWTVNDVNGGQTYTIQDVTFPSQGNPMAWICFNPSATTPPMTSLLPHSGAKVGASFSSIPAYAPSKKWLISPKMYLGINGKLELWVQSYTDAYGLEEYNVCVSETGTAPGDFTCLNGSIPEKAPLTWTLRSYPLNNYAGKEVYLGIECVSNDAFIFLIDDISITSTVGLDEKEAAGCLVYPNPVSAMLYVKFIQDSPDSFTMDLYNTIGMKVRSVASDHPGDMPVGMNIAGLSEGVYFLKIHDGSSSITKKVMVVE